MHFLGLAFFYSKDVFLNGIRRIKATIIMFYKIINNIVSVNFPQHLQRLTTRTRGHHLKFLSISARVNSYHHSFLPRAIRLWNSFLTNVVTRPNLRHFCNEFDMHLHSFWVLHNVKLIEDNSVKGLSQAPRIDSLIKRKLVIINCQSLFSKKDSIAYLVSEHKPDFIMGSESWLTNSILNNAVFPPNFTIFRKDKVSEYGAVFIACKSTVQCKPIKVITECELVACEVQVSHGPPLVIISVYRPPYNCVLCCKCMYASSAREERLCQLVWV